MARGSDPQRLQHDRPQCQHRLLISPSDRCQVMQVTDNQTGAAECNTPVRQAAAKTRKQ